MFPALCPELSATLVGSGSLLVLVVAGVLLCPDDWLEGAPAVFSLDDDDDVTAARKEILAYISIPVVSCLFTYFHIWLALWMMFYPIAFVGVLQLPDWTGMGNMGLPGWQVRGLKARTVSMRRQFPA